jgi:hypothetical protein
VSGLRPTRIGEVWIRRDGDETAVFNRSSGHLIHLNPTALAIWEMCDGETEVIEIVDAIVELTGRPRSAVMAEVESTVESLEELDLISGE